MRTGPYRIAHILPFPSVGGTETATLRIIRNLPDDLFRHCVFHLASAPAVARWLGAAGVECRSFMPVEPSYRHPLPFLRFSRNLARSFRGARIDLVHCADILAAHHCFLGAKLATLPIVCHVRNPYPTISCRDRSFLWWVDRFVFVSEDAWRVFAVKVQAPRGRVIYDTFEFAEVGGPEPEEPVREELGLPPECRIVGMAARVAPQKDHETLIRAAKRVLLAAPNTRFLMIGDNSDSPVAREHYAHIRQILAAEGLEGSFVFTGFRRDIGRLTAAMDVAVLSSHTEGLPLVLVEAMALAKPVVATAVGGTVEIISHGETGLLFAEGDWEALAVHILSVLEDASLARRLGVAGQQFVRTRFGAKRFMQDLKRVYEELLT